MSKLVERSLIEDADRDRAEELVALARLGGAIAGQVMALSMGADPNTVNAIGQALLDAEGGERDGR